MGDFRWSVPVALVNCELLICNMQQDDDNDKNNNYYYYYSSFYKVSVPSLKIEPKNRKTELCKSKNIPVNQYKKTNTI